MFDEYRVEVHKNGQLMYDGHQGDAAEIISEDLEKSLGLLLDLQDSVDNGKYYIYMHSDNYSEFSEEQIESVEKFGLNDDDEECTQAIKNNFNIEVFVKEKWPKPDYSL